MQEGSCLLIEEAIRRGRGGSLGVVGGKAIRRGEKSCFTQGGEERLIEAQKVRLTKRMRDF